MKMRILMKGATPEVILDGISGFGNKGDTERAFRVVNKRVLANMVLIYMKRGMPSFRQVEGLLSVYRKWEKDADI